MAAGYLELYIEQGESFSANISLVGTNESSYNLATYSAKSDIRKSYWSETITASFDTFINVGSGDVVISLRSNTSQEITAGRYVYDLFLMDASSNTRSKILEGILFIEPSATKI